MKQFLSIPSMSATDMLVVAVCGAIIYGYIRLLLLVIEVLKGTS